MSDNLMRHFFGGFVRMHILYHAAREPVWGGEIMEELERHGYKLGPGRPRLPDTPPVGGRRLLDVKDKGGGRKTAKELPHHQSGTKTIPRRPQQTP